MHLLTSFKFQLLHSKCLLKNDSRHKYNFSVGVWNFYIYIGRHLKFIIRSLHDLEGFSYVALLCKIFSSSKFNNTSTLNMDYSSFVNILFCTLIFYLAFPSVFWSMNFWDNVKWIILSTKTFHLNRKELHLLTFRKLL